MVRQGPTQSSEHPRIIITTKNGYGLHILDPRVQLSITGQKLSTWLSLSPLKKKENQTCTVYSLEREMITPDAQAHGVSKNEAIPSTDLLEMLTGPRVLMLVQQELKFSGLAGRSGSGVVGRTSIAHSQTTFSTRVTYC